MKKEVLFCFSVLFTFSVFAFGAAGDLDPTFGTGGIVIENFSNTSNVLGLDAVIQPSGKIVAVGQYFITTSDSQIALARFSVGGVLDTSFGTNGWTIEDFGYPYINAMAAAQQTDGKIAVTGQLRNGTTFYFYVARFTADGQVDSDFGNGGITVIDFGVTAQSTDLAIASDDKIVIVGFVGSTNENYGLSRVDKKGKLDKSFGKHGLAVTDFHGFLDRAVSVAIQADQKIVAAGAGRTSISYGVMEVARYTDKGELDPTFGTGGKLTTDFGSAEDDFGNAIEIQSNGKILVGGFSQPVTALFTFVRYNTNGTIDLSHTEDYAGSVFDAAYGLAIAPNGRIILGGRLETFDSTTASIAVACFNGTTGNLDTNFGTSGWTVTSIGPDYENISNLRLQTNNNIVAVGASRQGDGRYHLVLTRYIAC